MTILIEAYFVDGLVLDVLLARSVLVNRSIFMALFKLRPKAVHTRTCILHGAYHTRSDEGLEIMI